MNGQHRTAMIMQGVTCAIFIAALLLLGYATFNNSSKPEDRFKVVDKYKNCNVIRYTDPSNNWHYFFRCGT